MPDARSEILASLTPSGARYWFGVVMLFALAILLLYLAAAAPGSSVLAQIALALFGGVALLQGIALYRSGRRGIFLTKEGVFDSAGNPLCTLDQIESVDRGAFAFKPSNGFLLRLNTALGRAWHPGLWWRFGKRVGIGGITSAAEGKQMADIIAVILRDRDSDEPLMPDLLK